MKETPLLRTAVIAAALAFGAAPVGAQQYTNSNLATIDYTAGVSCNRYMSSQVTGTSVSCPTQATPFGTMAASASADLLTRTVRTSARLTDDGTDTTSFLYAQTAATIGNSLTVTGGSGAHDYLLFRFLTNEPGGIVGGSPFVSQGGVGHEFYLVLNGSIVGHYGRDDHAGGPPPKFNVSIMPGTTHALGAIDVMLDFFAVSGVFRYEFSTQTGMHFLNGPHAPRVLDEFGSMDATLAGLDLVDAGGNVLASAAFDQLGNATLDAAIAAPEPVTSILFATGLATIGLVVRGRRRDAMPSSTASRRRPRD